MIPFCGGAIASIWALIVEIFGLAEMQETTVAKSAIAIFAPIVVCCILGFVFWAAIMAMVMGPAQRCRRLAVGIGDRDPDVAPPRSPRD